MLRFAFPIVLFAVLAGHAAQADDRVGFKEITVSGTDGSHPLPVSLWYPTDDNGPREVVAERPVLYGVSAVRDAKLESGPHPLVLLSHGYGGSWRNLSWLADDLARKGYVVAAPSHPGTMAVARKPGEAVKLWERPRDLSRVIDALLADQSLAGDIAAQRIAAIGHSLGGWTVTEIAGGRFEADLVMKDCEKRFGAVSCETFTELGIGESAAATAQLKSDLSDARVGAVVTLDLGPARGFSPESLAGVHVPFLVIAAGADIAKEEATKAKIAATNKDSRYLAEHLPTATASLAEIPDALHFSFMQICKPGAIPLIEKEEPGSGIICKDGGERDRQAIHRETADMIIAFLAKALPSK